MVKRQKKCPSGISKWLASDTISVMQLLTTCATPTSCSLTTSMRVLTLKMRLISTALNVILTSIMLKSWCIPSTKTTPTQSQPWNSSIWFWSHWNLTIHLQPSWTSAWLNCWESWSMARRGRTPWWLLMQEKTETPVRLTKVASFTISNSQQTTWWSTKDKKSEMESDLFNLK